MTHSQEVPFNNLALATQGFTLWKGGANPVEKGVRLRLVFRDGSRSETFDSTFYRWADSGAPRDIIAYRIEPQFRDIPIRIVDKLIPSNIDEVLEERGSRYGNFLEQATIVQEIKAVLHKQKNWSKLADDQKECLEMLATKISRILNGDPDFVDNYIDICGYAQLIVNRLEKNK